MANPPIHNPHGTPTPTASYHQRVAGLGVMTSAAPTYGSFADEAAAIAAIAEGNAAAEAIAAGNAERNAAANAVDTIAADTGEASAAAAPPAATTAAATPTPLVRPVGTGPYTNRRRR